MGICETFTNREVDHLSARHRTLMNSVLGENVEDLHEHHSHAGLGCRRSARQARQESKRSALPPTAPPFAERENHDPQVVAGYCLLGSWASQQPARRGTDVQEPEEVLAGRRRIKDIEELRQGERFFRIMAVTCNSDLSPAPGLLSPWGGVVATVNRSCRRTLRLQHNVPTTSIQQKGHS